MHPYLSFVYNACPVFMQNIILTGYSAILDSERYGGRFKEYADLMLRAQWFSRGELEAYQDEKLRDIIRHAYETVPYYRRVFDERGLKPSAVKTQKDLTKLPLLTKDDIRKNFTALVSSNFAPGKLKYGHTSGTTGSPLEVGYDTSIIYATYAALDRQYRWAGCRLERGGDHIAVARGNVIVPLDRKKPPFWRYNSYHNQLLLSSFHMSKVNLPHYLEEMRRFGAKVLDGYPSTLYVLAKHLKNSNSHFPLKAVISSSETLYDFQRETIEQSFQCRVFDYYAVAERVVFATECEEHAGHHLAMEYGISEIIDTEGNTVPDGTTGRLVGTTLHNLGMPLIRYVTNDMTAVKTGHCPCGRGLKLMDDVTTKAEDTLTLKDGRLIPSSVLTHPFKPLNSVEESQIIQKDYDRILVKIVRRADYTDRDTQHLVRELKSRVGEDTKIEIEFVESISRTTAGKFRWVISEVPLGI
jgi:phenylacetate-CoA ligase